MEQEGDKQEQDMVQSKPSHFSLSKIWKLSLSSITTSNSHSNKPGTLERKKSTIGSLGEGITSGLKAALVKIPPFHFFLSLLFRTKLRILLRERNRPSVKLYSLLNEITFVRD